MEQVGSRRKSKGNVAGAPDVQAGSYQTGLHSTPGLQSSELHSTGLQSSTGLQTTPGMQPTAGMQSGSSGIGYSTASTTGFPSASSGIGSGVGGYDLSNTQPGYSQTAGYDRARQEAPKYESVTKAAVADPFHPHHEIPRSRDEQLPLGKDGKAVEIVQTTEIRPIDKKPEELRSFDAQPVQQQYQQPDKDRLERDRLDRERLERERLERERDRSHEKRVEEQISSHIKPADYKAANYKPATEFLPVDQKQLGPKPLEEFSTEQKTHKLQEHRREEHHSMIGQTPILEQKIVQGSLEIPQRTRTAFLTRYVDDIDNANLRDNIEVREVDVPELGRGEVLVRIECAPVDPADLLIMQGKYNKTERPVLPCRMGVEGSGIVVKTGGGFFGWLMSGKRVAVSGEGSGTWSEYAVVNAQNCAPLPDDVTFEEGCTFFVNPLTAVAFIELAKAGGHKVILFSAAASSLGKMVIRHAKRNDIDVICMVRREEQVQELRKLDVDNVINLSAEGWEGRLKRECEAHNCTLGFDCLGGSYTGKILRAMPPKAELRVFGALEDEDVGSISPNDLIFLQKKVTGFWLSEYIHDKNILSKRSMTSTVASHFKEDFTTDLIQKYTLDEISQAISYYNKNMGQGKVILCPTLRMMK